MFLVDPENKKELRIPGPRDPGGCDDWVVRRQSGRYLLASESGIPKVKPQDVEVILAGARVKDVKDAVRLKAIRMARGEETEEEKKARLLKAAQEIVEEKKKKERAEELKRQLEEEETKKQLEEDQRQKDEEQKKLLEEEEQKKLEETQKKEEKKKRKREDDERKKKEKEEQDRKQKEAEELEVKRLAAELEKKTQEDTEGTKKDDPEPEAEKPRDDDGLKKVKPPVSPLKAKAGQHSMDSPETWNSRLDLPLVNLLLPLPVQNCNWGQTFYDVTITSFPKKQCSNKTEGFLNSTPIILEILISPDFERSGKALD